jgi:ADP-ribose pyrophosphatase YjhB (NUDIX family)
MISPINYCPQCSEPVRQGIPVGDDRLRHICDACGSIHYQNPKVIAGCIPVFGERVLLCKRAIEPRLGYWTLPAGFMELGETLAEAACREAREEANVEVELDSLYTLISLPHISQVYAFFRGRMAEEKFSAGEESLEVRLFYEQEIPWDDLAFETVRRSLKLFFNDRQAGEFTFRTVDLMPDPIIHR